MRDIVNHDKSFAGRKSGVPPYGVEIGDRIRLAREAKDLNQTQLGDAVGVGQTAVSMWERGNNNVGIEDIKNIAKVTGAPQVWIAFGDDAIPEDEARLLAAYRNSDEAKRSALLTVLGVTPRKEEPPPKRRPFAKRS
jgi:transcriptional regulator with XRE-family HTH domain